MTSSTEWYQDWFDDNYLALYSHRDNRDAQRQIDLILKKLNLSADDRVLDLGCGNGRHVAELTRRGFQIVGLDLSEALLATARKDYPHCGFIRGDMRYIPGRFDIILSLFTSFGYFERDAENQKVFAAVSASLNPGGRFWLDFLNAYTLREHLEPEEQKTLSQNVRVYIQRRIEDGFVVKDIQFQTSEGEINYRERVRMYTKEDLKTMLESAGLGVENVFGDYSGTSWTHGSERTIMCCNKISCLQ